MSSRGIALLLLGAVVCAGRADVPPEDLPPDAVRALIVTQRTNQLGCERVIVPPFTPITASGTSLSVLLRRTTLGALGLPTSIQALDREILVEPTYFELVRGGKVFRVDGPEPTVRVASDGCTAKVRAQAKTAGPTGRLFPTLDYGIHDIITT